MGGSFTIQPIIQPIKSEDNNDWDSDYYPSWFFNYSYFHSIKATILHGAVDYFRDLSKKDLTKDFLINESLVADTARDESEVVVITNARSRISDIGDPLFFQRAMQYSIPAYLCEVLLSLPYNIDKVLSSSRCPHVFEQLNFEGIYLMMSMPDNRHRISYDEAQLLVSMLDKVDKFCDWKGVICPEEVSYDGDDDDDDSEDKEKLDPQPARPAPLSTSQSLRASFAKCQKTEVIVI
ncbi:hypothetical protein H0H81_011564 [Sphagnurus paluster]|uniref:Uncharacterized protein n=1 Tax=Sphagnurus paluster TaxID=117069 RepID=A0A9P7GRB0_9AGAR|nr:hypothetical protein H0H81_011564 [Sphagnurus paluster]